MVCPALWWGECKGRVQTLLLLPDLQKWKWPFWVLPYLIVHNLSQMCTYTVTFSPLQFLCVVLLEEMFFHVQALQSGVPGPSLSQDQGTHLKAAALTASNMSLHVVLRSVYIGTGPFHVFPALKPAAFYTWGE